MLDTVVRDQRHHVMIAGTGRAGTTFLVRYLTELGLNTHLSLHPEAGEDRYALAGLEELPFADAPGALPYVIKSPWLYEYIDETLRTVRLDAVIVPIRDLTEAATSRVLVERDAMHRAAPWLAERDTAWRSWGWKAGGAVFSLDPVDQARLLAVGFHRLIERLVRADIPIIFLSFPRMVLDADYLFRKLGAVIPHGTTLQAAQAAHARIADADKIRVQAGLAAQAAEPDAGALDAIAMRRQLDRLRGELRDLHAEVAVIRGSRSWKLTAPLRRIMTMLRGAAARRR